MRLNVVAAIPTPVESLLAIRHRTLLPDAEVHVLLVDQELSFLEEHFPAELAGFVELLLVVLLDLMLEFESDGELL
jgi:hypothetical protein